jgi:hypothetical protein
MLISSDTVANMTVASGSHHIAICLLPSAALQSQEALTKHVQRHSIPCASDALAHQPCLVTVYHCTVNTNTQSRAEIPK